MADVWGDRHNIDPDDPVLNDRGWVAARLSNLYAEIDHLRAEARRARELEARVEALEQLTTCYRIGRHPPEKLLNELTRTRAALADLEES